MENGTNIGRRIGRYEIREEIGRGGMASVYRARDLSLERDVALKLLHPHLASHDESRERFAREAKAVARLKHSAVLEIYDYAAEPDSDAVYIVMELVEGTTLRKLLEERRDEPLPAEAAALIIRQVAVALEHAHKHGIVHRDVKPENILIAADGAVKLSDFGIAHLAGATGMTSTGQILGSPAYMSPEHIELADPDSRADLFSVGSVLYETAVGRLPFEGANPHAMIKRIVEGRYEEPMRVNPLVGHPISAAIHRCLANRPEDRFGSAQELVDALDAALALSGIEPSETRSRDYLDDPDVWFDRLRPSIVTRTLDAGLEARQRGERSKALDHFNRVLALEPGNERALTAVNGIFRGLRARVVIERAAIALLILVLVGAVAFAVGRSPVEVTEAVAIDAGSFRSDRSDQDATLAPERRDAGRPVEKTSKTKIETLRRPKPPAAHAIRHPKPKRQVVFTPYPLAVSLAVDDADLRQYGTTMADRSRTLTVGRHRVRIVPNDPERFVEQTFEFDVPEGEGEGEGEEPFHVRRRLRWREARVLVRTNVPARITIPARATGEANAPFDVAMKKGPEEQVSVLVSAQGYIPRTKRVTIRAGELAELDVALAKDVTSAQPRTKDEDSTD